MRSVLCVSGSLRGRSTNTEVLRAAALLAPPGMRVTLSDDLAKLPHFNPDVDEEGMIAPPAVQTFRDRVAGADALMICSPEYAHGVPGVLKNALDWLVSSPAIVNKPVSVINASPRSSHAIASLAETLRTMSVVLVPAEPVSLPVNGRRLDASAIAGDPELASILRAALAALGEASMSP